ncbi:nitrate reductase [Ceratobasidium sp. AG-Ba]|nr:nitrate reductase [Ceratobasidium sp. AG-Ba]
MRFQLVILPTCTAALITCPAHSRRWRRGESRDELLRLDTQDPSNTRIQQRLANFELVYGVPAEYDLGRALETVVSVRGRSLNTWPYDIHPDLSSFGWMSYEQSRRVLSGTPPTIQPPPIPTSTLSSMDVYVFVGSDAEYTLKTILGISINSGNVSIPVDPRPSLTQEPETTTTALVPPQAAFFLARGSVFAALVAACVLCSIFILGGLGWWIAMRRHLRQTGTAVRCSRSSDHSTDPRGRSPTPRWPRTNVHPLSFGPFNAAAPTLTHSTRRRVRTVDHESPTTPSPGLSPEHAINCPEKSVISRKRAATLLQTIHTRTIRGSPRIGSIQNGLSPEMPSRRLCSPKVGCVPRIDAHAPRNGPPLLEQSERDEYTSSWCSALDMDPFRSLGDVSTNQDGTGHGGANTGSTRYAESLDTSRPMSPTPKKGLWGVGHQTMSLSEFDHNHSIAGKLSFPSHGLGGNNALAKSSALYIGPVGLNEGDTTTPKTSHIQAASKDGQASVGYLVDKRANRHETYAARTNEIGKAILATPSKEARPRKSTGPLELSFDSFFSPKSETEEAAFHDYALEPRYGDVSSERMVRIAPSQETSSSTYATAPEPRISPVALKDETSSSGHEQPEDIGIIGSPSTNHSQMAELDDISSPLLAEPEDEGEEPKAGEKSSQSLTVEYGRADRSLRTLDSFPGMMRGSLSYFPEDVELNTPVLSLTSRTQLSYRESTDILLLPEEDLSLGYVNLARVGSVGRNSQSQELQPPNECAKLLVAKGSQGNESHGTTEDSIVSPNLSEQKSTRDDSILSRTKGEDESADSPESSNFDRSSSGLRYAAHLFDSPKA